MLRARHRKLLLGAVTIAALALATLFAGIASAAPNPPGDNGTVKIDDVPFDDHPDEEPHVGCTFQVDFYGFDEGDLFADVTFEAHPPKGPVQVLLTDTVFIGEDDNSGGGSEAGLDASATYTLDLSGIEPHRQGHHVTLTVNADGSQGADTKFKVFWVRSCPPSSSTSSTSTSSTSTTSSQSTSSTVSDSSTSSSVTTPTSSTVEGTTTTTTAAGVGPAGPSVTTGGGGLPLTGGSALPLLLAGLGLVGSGAAAIVAARRRHAT